jgi:glucose dehydrogenase
LPDFQFFRSLFSPWFAFLATHTADRDATEPPVLIDTEYQGKARKLLLHADRNGFFYVLDRTSGELLTGEELPQAAQLGHWHWP